MTKDELQAYLVGLLDERDDLGIVVYGLLKGAEDAPRKLDIDNDSLAGLKALFLASIESRILQNEELSVLPLSSADERTNAIYEYDLAEVPVEVNSMQIVAEHDDIDAFDFTEESLRDMGSLIVEIGNNDHQIVIYKSMAPVNVFGQSSFFLKKHDTRFEKIKDEFVRISPGFQMLKVEDSLLITELRAVERSFGFDSLIRKEAQAGISAIDAMDLVENIDVLQELADDLRYARKFTKIAKSSPVIEAGVTNQSIIGFCESFPALQGKIRFNDAGDQICLDTKKSKDLFIKLLMDDFLTSELTDFHYTSVAKDKSEAANE